MSQKPPLHIILDSDMGTDDLMALTNICHHARTNENVKLEAISLVKGLQLCVKNAADLLVRFHKATNFLSNGNGSVCPIFMGFEERMDPPNSNCFSEADWYQQYDFERIHSDLANLLNLPQIESNDSMPVVVNSENYVTEMMELLRKAPDNYFTLLCIGPLTNIAKLIECDRSLVYSKIQQVLIMGGALRVKELANQQNGSEWNFYCDGKAAKMVIQAFGEKIKLFDLSVANLNVIEEKNRAEYEQLINKENTQDSPIVKLRKELLKITMESASYDTSTSCYLFHPEMFTFEKYQVVVFGEKPNEGVIKKAESDEELMQSTTINCATSIDKDNFFIIVKDLLSDTSEYYNCCKFGL